MRVNIPKHPRLRLAAISAGFVRSNCRPRSLPRFAKCQPDAISNPIPVPGGFSIIAVQDTRKILDARSAGRNSQPQAGFDQHSRRARPAKRPSRSFPASPKLRKTVGGCGGADKLAADFHGEVVTSDQVKMRDLPPALQRLMLPMQVGQATQPFGSLDEGVRVLVMCGRDEVDQSAPTYDDVYQQINEERTNSRARRYLADLRRDAVIEFR